MIEVKVIQLPGLVKEVALNDGATVADALSAAGVEQQPNQTLNVNGRSADQSTILNDGDKVVLAKGAAGAR